MKILLLHAVAWLSLTLAASGKAASQTQGADHRTRVTITWQVQLDNADGFDFGRLRALVQYRPDKGRAWVPLPIITADSSGAFTSTTLAGNWISLQIGTSDPTIRDSTDRSDPFRSYELGATETHTASDQEFYVPADSPGVVQKIVQLQRGAGFKLCIPLPIKTGRISYRLRADKSKRVNVILVTYSSGFRDHTLAGLAPGDWIVEYVEGDAVRLSQEFELRQGEVLNAACRPGFLVAP